MSQPLACKNEDFSKSCFDRPPVKQPAFQIHVDEPDGACAKKQVAETLKARPVLEESPLAVGSAVTQLREPLANLNIPPAMDVSFGGLSSFLRCSKPLSCTAHSLCTICCFVL